MTGQWGKTHPHINSIEVTVAEERHIPGIVAVWQELMDYHRKLNDFFTLRTDAGAKWEIYLRKNMGEGLVVVALDNREVVGYCIATVKDYPPLFVLEKHGFISDMCVIASHRNRGIGEIILGRAFDWFASQGLGRVELRVEHDNEIGKAFWKKHGFEVSYYTLLREG